MGGGAVIAAAAAARAKRLQRILDAFRLAGATAPDRAHSMDALSVERDSHVEELVRYGVLVAGPRSDTWYLDEAGYIAHRSARQRTSRMAVLTAVAALIVLLGIIAIVLQQRNS